MRPRLLGQPLEVLLRLLEQPGNVVTREELRLRLWPADTFVDYDHSLNAAVNKLREALNDSADNPRFIQTIPRRGYRFIGTLETVSEDGDSPSGATPVDAIGPFEARQAIEVHIAEVSDSHHAEKRRSLLSNPGDLPAILPSTMRVLFSLLQVMYLCFYIFSLAKLPGIESLLSQFSNHSTWLLGLIVVTSMAGIAVRLFMLSAVLFGYRGLTAQFLIIFPVLFPVDELWALAPFLLINRIGVGLALAATAALIYAPFAQRSLLLMNKNES